MFMVALNPGFSYACIDIFGFISFVSFSAFFFFFGKYLSLPHLLLVSQIRIVPLRE